MSTIGHSTLSARIADQIKEYIIEKNLQPGQKLPTEEQLTVIFGASRTTIREALKRIVDHGILDIKPKNGAVIKAFDPLQAIERATWGYHLIQDERILKELFQFRYALEMSSIPLIASGVTEHHIETLKDSCVNIAKAPSISERRVHDAIFHKTLVDATGNRVFSQIGAIIIDFFLKAIQVFPQSDFPRATNERIFIDHERICNAVERRDTADLRVAMDGHFAYLKDFFDNFNPEETAD